MDAIGKDMIMSWGSSESGEITASWGGMALVIGTGAQELRKAECVCVGVLHKGGRKSRTGQPLSIRPRHPLHILSSSYLCSGFFADREDSAWYSCIHTKPLAISYTCSQVSGPPDTSQYSAPLP